MTRARDRGQSTVELALALPVIVVLLLLMVQVALAVRDHLLLVHAAREAVRSAAVATIAERGSAARRGATTAGPLDPDRLQVGEEVLPGGDRVRVRVEYLSRSDLPVVGLLLPDLRMTADATMRLEADR